MTEPISDDALLDRLTREPPPILETMQLVWAGQQPAQITEDFLLTQKLMRDDPKAFLSQLVGLEKGYQAQVLEANKRDRRIRELEARVVELEARVGSGVNNLPGEVDPGTGRVLDLIDRLREQYEVERGRP